MSSTIRIAGALLAPLALGACGLPIGVQIASLFADGVSYVTTDKSLTDHGLSAVTGEDCAIWRGVEGNKICKDPKEDKESETIVAALGEPKRRAAKPAPRHMGDAELPAELSGGETEMPKIETPVIAFAEPAKKSTVLAMAPAPADGIILGTAPSAPAETAPSVRRIAKAASIAVTAPTPATAPIESVKLAEALPPPPPPAPKLTAAKPPAAAPRVRAVAKLEKVSAKVPATAPKKVMAKIPTQVSAKAAIKAPAKTEKATYYIIASYHRATDALRFSKTHGKFKPQVIEGTASGHQVFRVAVGPFDKNNSRAVKARLKKAGFKDTWRLAHESAPVETEVAQVR